MTGLLTAEDVAAQLGISVNQVKRRSVAEDWPRVQFSARTIRYRAEHVDQIVAMHEKKPTSKPSASGQTARSRRRAS